MRDLEVEEIYVDEEKEVKSLEKDCAGEEIVCGTHLYFGWGKWLATSALF